MSSPRRRPPLTLRVLIALIGLAAMAFNAVLMLSDRAPGYLQRVGGDALTRLFARIDLGGRGADVLNDPRLPESDTIVHIAVWAIATVLVGWALWSWIGLVAGSLAVFAASAVIEKWQGSATSTRQVERSDLAANFTGVAVGAVFVAFCYLLFSGLAALFSRRPYS